MASGVIDGKIYLCSGFGFNQDMTDDSLFNNLSVYDPESNTWDTTREGVPVPRYMNPGNTALDGKLYLIGGTDWEPIDDGWKIVPYARVDVYDPQSDTWELKANLPIPLGEAGLCSMDGKIYVSGGTTNENIVLSSLYSYDPVSDEWKELAQMSAPRNGHVSIALDGRIYVIGGGSSFLTESTSCEVYDPVSDQWTSIASLPKAIIWHGGCAVDGEIYIFGGQKVREILGDSYKYNPEEDTWIRIESLFPHKKDIIVAPIGRTIYLLGGRTSGYVISPLVETFELSDIILSNKIPDDTISGDAIEVDLSEYFSHLEGGEITYSVCLDDSGILEASIDGSMLTVTGMASGDAEVSILAESGEDQMGYSFQVNVLSTGIDGPCEMLPALQIYPNPSNGMATMAYWVQSPGIVRLEVSDLTGKRVSVPLSEYRYPGEYEHQLNTADLMPGIYICRLITSDGRTTVKLMVE
jgi:N-acetylneuraminic acid mutarotase